MLTIFAKKKEISKNIESGKRLVETFDFHRRMQQKKSFLTYEIKQFFVINHSSKCCQSGHIWPMLPIWHNFANHFFNSTSFFRRRGPLGPRRRFYTQNYFKRLREALWVAFGSPEGLFFEKIWLLFSYSHI